MGENFFDHKCYAACAEGLVFYQGHCLNLKTDPNNCGEINNRCDVVGGDPCYNGECLLTCPADVPEATDCAGTCTDLSSDYYNCGACGKSCGNSDSVNRSCQKSVCVTTCGGKVCTAPPNSTPTCENDIQITAPVTPQICGFTCDSGYVKNPAGTACVKASSCDPLTEVSVDGHCYYLDGSAGKCDAGYTLGSESVLSLGLFAGKTYKHTQSNNCCITTSEPLQNFGMGTNCNQPGLFGARDPEKGAHGCTAQVNRSMHQLTLCGR